MLMGELLSLGGLGLPVKVMLFNNSTLGMVRIEMAVAGYIPSAPTSGTQISERSHVPPGSTASASSVRRTSDRRSRARSRTTGRR